MRNWSKFAFLLCLPAVAAEAQLPVPPPHAHAAQVEPAPVPAHDNLCPLTVFIDAKGDLYDSRFGGRYHVSEQTLRNDIGGGCKERGRTSSVAIKASPKTKYGRVKEVMDIVQHERPDIPVAIVTPNAKQ